VTVRQKLPAAEHHRHRARAQGQGRELLAELIRRRVWRVQPVDRAFGDLVTDLAVNDQRVLDLAAFDHARGDVHAVLTGVGQPQVSVHD